MNGIVNETSKQVGSFLDIMRQQPLVLALIILSFALIGLLYLQSVQFTSQRRENVALFVKVQGDVQALLAQCVIPPRPQ